MPVLDCPAFWKTKHKFSGNFEVATQTQDVHGKFGSPAAGYVSGYVKTDNTINALRVTITYDGPLNITNRVIKNVVYQNDAIDPNVIAQVVQETGCQPDGALSCPQSCELTLLCITCVCCPCACYMQKSWVEQNKKTFQDGLQAKVDKLWTSKIRTLLQEADTIVEGIIQQQEKERAQQEARAAAQRQQDLQMMAQLMRQQQPQQPQQPQAGMPILDQQQLALFHQFLAAQQQGKAPIVVPAPGPSALAVLPGPSAPPLTAQYNMQKPQGTGTEQELTPFVQQPGAAAAAGQAQAPAARNGVRAPGGRQ